MSTRRNILSLSLVEVQRLTKAFNTLKTNGTYDAFVRRHMQAMMAETPPNAPTTDRNTAHRGPAFLPWHRASLLELANALRSVDPLIDDLPYWRWQDDAALYGNPRNSPLWTTNYLGPDGNPSQGDRVLTGPFANWKALVYNTSTGRFRQRSNRGLIRRLGRDPQGMTTLPAGPDVTDLWTNPNYQKYDASPWDETTMSFRNRVEGWYAGSALHNQVHLYVGGDMLVGTSPNDPVFWLNHCNVDGIWTAWQSKYGINSYLPSSGGPTGHNLDDRMQFLITPRTPRSVLDWTALGYVYA